MKQNPKPHPTWNSSRYFGALRSLCHHPPCVEVHRKIIHLLERSFDVFPEETLQHMLPYVVTHFGSWRDDQFDHYHEDKPWTQALISIIPLVALAIQRRVMAPSPVVMKHIYTMLVVHAVDYIEPHQAPRPLGRELPHWDRCWSQLYAHNHITQPPSTDDYFINQRQYVQVLALSNFLHIQSHDKPWGDCWADLVKMKRDPLWRALVQSVESDLGRALEPQDGLWPEELDIIQAQLPSRLPGHVVAFYRLFGRLPQLFGGDIYQPFRWCHGGSPILGLYRSSDDVLWSVDCRDPSYPMVPIGFGMWLGQRSELTLEWPLHKDLQDGYFGIQRKITFVEWIKCLINERRPPALF